MWSLCGKVRIIVKNNRCLTLCIEHCQSRFPVFESVETLKKESPSSSWQDVYRHLLGKEAVTLRLFIRLFRHRHQRGLASEPKRGSQQRELSLCHGLAHNRSTSPLSMFNELVLRELSPLQGSSEHYYGRGRAPWGYFDILGCRWGRYVGFTHVYTENDVLTSTPPSCLLHTICTPISFTAHPIRTYTVSPVGRAMC